MRDGVWGGRGLRDVRLKDTRTFEVEAAFQIIGQN